MLIKLPGSVLFIHTPIPSYTGHCTYHLGSKHYCCTAKPHPPRLSYGIIIPVRIELEFLKERQPSDVVYYAHQVTEECLFGTVGGLCAFHYYCFLSTLDLPSVRRPIGYRNLPILGGDSTRNSCQRDSCSTLGDVDVFGFVDVEVTGPAIIDQQT